MDLMNIWFQWKKHDFSGPFFDFSPGFAALVSIEEEFASQDLQCLHQLPPGSLRSANTPFRPHPSCLGKINKGINREYKVPPR